MIILGIDPGTARIGYGVIERTGGTLKHHASGILPIAPHLSENNRLPIIEREFEKLIIKAHPDRMGIERLFFSKNQKTAMSVAQARGVLVNAAMRRGIPIAERTPLQVKIAVTSDGKATKRAVAFMVRKLLALPKELRLIDDATDALAIAISVANHLDDAMY
jgi:crossover junction endodeoxyribonuclease RuvC